MAVTEKNIVITRVWASSGSGLPTARGVGHVSVEVPALREHGVLGSGYYSLWPNWEATPDPKIPTPYWWATAQPRLMEGYKRAGQSAPQEPYFDGHAYDLDYERRPPERTVCLYSLNHLALRNKATEIKKDPEFGWSLIGGGTFIPIAGRTCSCATFALAILRAGGFNEASSSWSSSVRPDQFIDWLIQAKQEELRLYSYTSEFRHEDETPLLALFQQRKGCIIL